MRVGRVHVYAVLAVAVALAYGVGVGPYWLADMVVLAVVAVAVACFCLSREAKTTDVERSYRALPGVGKLVDRPVQSDGTLLTPEQREHVPRSRIAHYVTVSRIKSTASTAWLRRESDSPFERVLLGEPRWQRLSREGLDEITKKAPYASAKSPQ